jgi:hypothetical protein
MQSHVRRLGKAGHHGNRDGAVDIAQFHGHQLKNLERPATRA